MDKRKTWFLDFDGTLVFQKSYLSEVDSIIPQTLDFFKSINEDDCIVITTGREEFHRERIENFMKSYGLRFDFIICGLPTGKRIIVNDTKPDGTKTAHSINVIRDQGIRKEFIDEN